MFHSFQIRDRKIRLWQREGESFRHVLLKALGFAMFVDEYPDLEIETDVGLRYTPDLISFDADRDFRFWGECGMVSIKKTAWLLKHTRTPRIAILKMNGPITHLAKQLREEVPAKYRPKNRLELISFSSNVIELTASGQIGKVDADWYTKINV
jgi:hypothetical protein